MCSLTRCSIERTAHFRNSVLWWVGILCLLQACVCQHTKDLTPATVVVAVDGIAGYTTYQLKAILGSSLKNCYTIAGAVGHPSNFPAALQVDAPFGVHVGGTNPAYWSYKSETQYDSWLTVGNTRGEQPSLGHIDIPFSDWSETQPLEFHNGAIFWMKPDAGPSQEVVRICNSFVRQSATNSPMYHCH